MVLYTPGRTSSYPDEPVESGIRIHFLGGGNEVGNVGVVLEDQGAIQEAMDTYLHTLNVDPALPDVHYNLARLYEHQGDRQAALRHFSRFKALSGQRDDIN